MTILVAVALTVVTFAFVAYPILRQRSRPTELSEDEKLHALYSNRDTTYSMLKELEFDFHSGILTKEDYHDLESRYKKKAISILSDIDELGKSSNVEEAIEKQVQRLRQVKSRFCSQCGAKYQEGARFCSHCGASLKQKEAS